jgi:hypothetical protein
MSFAYKPTELKLPKLPQLKTNMATPTFDIKNRYAKSILDTLGKPLKAPTAFSQTNSFSDALSPTQELGRQFTQRVLLPDFQQNTYNPFITNLANQAAGSNLGLMGNARQFVDARKRETTQPFLNQAQQVEDAFNSLAYQDLNNILGSLYGSQLNF